jgi:hypothetical protein
MRVTIVAGPTERHAQCVACREDQVGGQLVLVVIDGGESPVTVCADREGCRWRAWLSLRWVGRIDGTTPGLPPGFSRPDTPDDLGVAS